MSTNITLLLPDLLLTTDGELSTATITALSYGKDTQSSEATTVHNGFSKEEKIAEGGMSFIFRGIQHSLDREVAIKESKSTEGIFDQILYHESIITGRLEHPNIVPIHDMTQEYGRCKVVLKLLQGQTLTASLEEWRENDIHIDNSIPVLLKVCDALTYAHDKQILHRDIKPENIMICDHGAVYLLDWGIALDMSKRSSVKNMVVGTLRYMPPEMLGDNPAFAVDERSDVFLLGATLHEVLTGKQRHDAPAVSKVLEQIQESLPSTYPIEYSKFGEVCNKACAKNPQDRYKNIKQFAHALQGAWDAWKQRFLLDQALAMLEELQMIDTGGYIPETDAHIFQLYIQTRSAFTGFLMFDPTNREANAGLETANIILLRYFLRRKEVSSITWMVQIVAHVPEEMRAEIDALLGSA